MILNINELRNVNEVLNFLLYAGYLTYEYAGKEGERRDKRLRVKIPNEEVREVFESVQEEMRKRGVKKVRMIGMGFVDKIVGVKIENKDL